MPIMTPGICAAPGFIRDSQNYLFCTRDTPLGLLQAMWVPSCYPGRDVILVVAGISHCFRRRCKPLSAGAARDKTLNAKEPARDKTLINAKEHAISLSHLTTVQNWHWKTFPSLSYYYGTKGMLLCFSALYRRLQRK
jgi:hypothetical protein